MIVNNQKPIEFVNKCQAVLRELELESAILWYSRNLGKPVQRLKRVFMYGHYPAISIHGQKLHVHRLLWAYWSGRFPTRREYVHHKNGNKLDSRRENLELVYESAHQSMHNKGKIVSEETRKKHTENNKRLWNTRWKHRRIYENPELLK